VDALLVLWDIDHTLTENHGVNKEIYASKRRPTITSADDSESP
jgi:hypothetical protein